MSNKHKFEYGAGMCVNDARCMKCGTWIERGDEDQAGECSIPDFELLPRYSVFKASDVMKLPPKQLREVLALLAKVATTLEVAGMPMRQCVVLENDEPGYANAVDSIARQWYRKQRLSNDGQMVGVVK